MNETQYEEKLLKLIEQLKNGTITRDEFSELARELGEELDKGPKGYMQINHFKDEELGWAKYWVEEMGYYGVDEVFTNHFDFIKFLDSRTN